MSTLKGIVVPPGGGRLFTSPTPGRSFAMKLIGQETDGSIMMFEQVLPAGTASLYHMHRDSDEVAWVLAGEFTFKIGDDVAVGGPGSCAFMPRNVAHAWKNTGSEEGRVVFLYTPAVAGGFIEELAEGRTVDAEERQKRFERHGWTILGPNPLDAAPKAE
ncbi:MAG TPA: cupin domain-containing protein [Candidatus Binatia bacterium]|nr:cupin domain-containing protein [Candidatus Binatia bacterium]